MRWLLFLTVLAFLAGCTEPAAEAPAEEIPDDEPGRTARGGAGDGGDDEDGDEPEMEPVKLMSTPLTFAGQGPQSFDLTVPPGIVSVAFAFSGGTTFEESGLRVELTDCGTYDGGVSFSASTGGGAYHSGKLCDAPAPGPATVTISATLMVFDGTFELIGFVPAANGTAAN